MAILCDTTTVAELSKCFTCLTAAQRDAVKTYLLAVMAGGSLDPATLIEEAKCYQCLTPKQLEMLQPYLMCLIGGGVTPPTECAALSGAGDPTGVTTPEFSGQLYHDTVADSYYRSTGTTSADWTAISGGPSYQDMQFDWEPANLKLGELSGFQVGSYSYSVPALAGITSLILRQQVVSEYVFIQSTASLASISFPNLTDVLNGSTLNIDYNTGLVSVSAPVLVSVTGAITFSTDDLLQVLDLGSLEDCYSFLITLCPSITSVSLPSFQTCTDLCEISDNASLVSVSMPSLVSASQIEMDINPLLTDIDLSSWVPTNGSNNTFQGNNLNATSVNALLARCVANAGFVSGNINISGGTNASPTGQGITDKNTLNARLAGLAVTN